MTVILTLTTAGSDSGPFDLYSNTDGYVTPFNIGVTKSALEGGYTTSLVPDGTTIVKVQSTGNCKTSVNIILTGGTTTSTTTSPVTNCVLNYGASMVPCIGGTVDDYMEAYIVLDNPVTVETIFEILVNYISGTPSGNCSNPTSQQTMFVTVLAGENQGQVTCPQAVFINSNGATICTVELVNSPYNVCV